MHQVHQGMQLFGSRTPPGFSQSAHSKLKSRFPPGQLPNMRESDPNCPISRCIY